MLTFLGPALWLSTWNWLLHLGGLGLILLGIADNSLAPLPGSMDVLTVWLAASLRPWWPYYAVMATLGSLIGGYITYSLAREGGREAMEKRLRKASVEKVYRRFERRGFWAVAVPALLPPPFPMVPFLLAAGALRYPRRKFLSALALGRGVRFTLLAGLASLYGPSIVQFFARYHKPALFTLLGLAVLGGIFALVEYLRFRRRQSGENHKASARKTVA
ncbi:MAG TPA: VTT domain-containing protein [Terriglobales bacterium]|nr:VTT domain-containing protein [Terriglobales bacterium]